MAFSFQKVLIANRGEIAVRVIRACRELGLQTVSVYSEVDRGSAHVPLADESYSLGDAGVTESYLNMGKVFSIIEKSGADAVHPGFGFFSENVLFALECERRGIVFIGPKPDVIEQMGDKLRARKVMKEAGVPIASGSDGPVRSLKDLENWSEKIGFPVLLKASAGGGGKGMRVVEKFKDLADAFENTQREAKTYFGNDEIFVEKFLKNPHHIEVQVVGDKYGQLVHVFERECSVQRRHQKVIEEAPSPFLTGHEEVRSKLFEVALMGARKIGYDSVGTMEFIVDNDRNFYFLEMNTRIQVEHPVTEWVSGVDLIKEQIQIAGGKHLSFEQSDLSCRGHSVEARLYAEQPNTFLPAPGTVTDTWYPGGPFVRVDTSVLNGQVIPIEYDPMIAKISTWGKDREEANLRMSRALGEVLVAGTITNLPFLRKVFANEAFLSGNYTTSFIEQEKKSLQSMPSPEEIDMALASLVPQDRSLLELEAGTRAPWVQEIHE